MNLNPEAIPTLFLAAGFFCIGYYLGGQRKSRIGWIVLLILTAALAMPGVLFVLYYTHLFDRTRWFYEFRTLPHVELLGSGLAVLGGVIQGRLRPQTFAEKLATPIITVALLFVPFLKSALDPVDYDRLRDTCNGEVCLQSTQSTCGPTSAATLLGMLGQRASEKELAHECFTYRGGTEIWYIARALRKRQLKTEFVIQQPSHISPPAPAIAGVILRGGAGHFVAIMSATPDEITVGDPLKGKLVIPRRDLTNSYHFTGFFLVIRSGTALNDEK
ncbi:MAG: cysteine peptidase family C39 domain-containing protein [Terriglobales bacterium]